ncbi:MAG: alanine/glycine:cation symporter family protein [Eubacteriales bacterium]|nr:alanine/glycine:cation symporter family protein [Eubacteriales bacterium]
MKELINVLDQIDGILYYPILMVILIAFGLYFSFRTRFVQLRLFPESIRVLKEKPSDGKISSFQALMVSTASRVGTGNIIGVSTAVCLGGPGAVFWMQLLAIIGGASAFIESTLAQIYKRGRSEKESYGGPGYYIEYALHQKWLGVLFVVFLILTYGFGFNMLCSYNLQSTFAGYSFYDEKHTPIVIGIIIAALVFICIMGGGKRMVRTTEVLVPIMGVLYVAVAFIVIIANITKIGDVIVMIFKDAFNFRAMISGGFGGSCMIYGIKRGLYSNEAGVGSAPNAAATATVSHPVKQGLVQMLSVYIDTLLLCTATALMCLFSGVARNPDDAGAPYVQNAVESVIGKFGPSFITAAMILFAFTTLIGNLYYVDNGLTYLNGKKMPGKKFMVGWRILCAVVIVLGAVIPMNAAWDLADIFMGGMAIINLPSCLALSNTAIKCTKDYERQKKEGKNPVFHAKEHGIDLDTIEFWK